MALFHLKGTVRMKNLAITFLMLATTFSAWAEVEKTMYFVEPMLSYEKSTGSVEYPAPFESSDFDAAGFGAGARVGMRLYEYVLLGFEGRYSILTFEDTITDDGNNASSWNYGPMIGAQLPSKYPVRLWASYILGSHLDLDEDSNEVDLKYTDGTGYRLGVGVKLKAIYLNLEYQVLSYRTVEVESVGNSITDVSADVDNDAKTWVLSASYPFEFGF